MGNGEGTIALEGIYAPAMFGRFRVIRGFATLQDLANASGPLPSKIREIDGEGAYQIDEVCALSIRRALEEGSASFFPEVSLSLRADYELVFDAAAREVGVRSQSLPRLSVAPASKVHYVGNGLTPPPGDGRPGAFPGLEFVRLQAAARSVLPLKHVVHIGREGAEEPLMSRLDGNHRLHYAADLVEDERNPTKYLAPFCLVLLGPLGDAEADCTEAGLFSSLRQRRLSADSVR
jgi:hypothetical protein